MVRISLWFGFPTKKQANFGACFFGFGEDLKPSAAGVCMHNNMVIPAVDFHCGYLFKYYCQLAIIGGLATYDIKCLTFLPLMWYANII